MPKKIKVKVTYQDLAEGIPRSGTDCPIAISLRRQGFNVVSVSDYSVFRVSGGDTVSSPLPSVATKFIHDFDDGVPVAPIEFELDYPEDEKVQEEIALLQKIQRLLATGDGENTFFSWTNSPQGFGYWSKVYDGLDEAVAALRKRL